VSREEPGTGQIQVTLPQVKQTPNALRFALPEERGTLPVSDIYVRKTFVRHPSKGLPVAVEVTVRPIYAADQVDSGSNRGGRA
jgi:hypothetical protein